jgi:hypothetical protein
MRMHCQYVDAGDGRRRAELRERGVVRRQRVQPADHGPALEGSGPEDVIWGPDRKTFLAFWPRNVLIGLLLILVYSYIESFLGRRNSFWGPNPKDGHGLPRGAVGTGHLKQNFGVPGHPQVGCDEAVEAEVVEAVPPARTLISLGALTSVKNGRE